MNERSPYSGVPRSKWRDITERLIERHPLSKNEIVNVVLSAWEDIFASQFGKRRLRIGRDLKPSPQSMGLLLHELIPAELEHRYPEAWCRDRNAREPDALYLPDLQFSFEIKTTSSKGSIAGNRSVSQPLSKRAAKKRKAGYYLAINFENFTPAITRPKIARIRFGWLDHEDWQGQMAASGQSAKLQREVEESKLLILYEAE